MSDAVIDAGILRCPTCGGGNLHHSVVEVYSRRREDGPVIATAIAHDGAPKAGVPLHNPSSRRHGLIIKFWCEECDGLQSAAPMALEIAQHKGATLINWRE